MRKAFLIITFVVLLLVSVVDQVHGQDGVGQFPPVVLTAPNALSWPKPGDCGFVDVYEVINQQFVLREHSACMRGYVTWLVGSPTAYYLEFDGSNQNVLIWSKETVNAYFKRF